MSQNCSVKNACDAGQQGNLYALVAGVCYMPGVSKRGWLSLGMCLIGAACALDERAVDTTPSGSEPGSDPPGSTPGGDGSSPASENPPGTDVPFIAGAPGSDPPNSGTPNSGTPNSGTPNSGTPGTGTPGVAPDPSLAPQGNTTGPFQSLTFGGDGFGKVTLSAPGLADQVCESNCQVSAPAGTLLTLQATAQPYSAFRSWSGAGCGALPACSIAVDANAALRVDFQLAYNVAFVTDQFYTVDQLPAPGAEANQECARLAAGAGLHGQRWVAWFAADGPTTAVQDDIAPAGLLQNPGGWVRTDGAPLATTRAALLSGGLLHPLNLTQTRVHTTSYSWSGAGLAGGLRDFDGVTATDCDNWTSTAADLLGRISSSISVGYNWTGGNVQYCNASATLQCFGDDPAPEVPLPPLPANARLAFLSNTSFTPNTGIGSADSICQRDACDAGLTGSSNCTVNLGTQRTFLSYLHTSQRPAWERFDLSGPTWYRPDGIQWLPEASNLALDGEGSLTGINVGPDGTFDVSRIGCWIGQAGGQSCEDWTSSAAMGGYGNFSQSSFPLVGDIVTSCESPVKVLCLQQ